MTILDLTRYRRMRSAEAVAEALSLEYGEDLHVTREEEDRIVEFLDKDFKEIFGQGGDLKGE